MNNKERGRMEEQEHKVNAMMEVQINGESTWLNKKEWEFMKAFRHYKETMFFTYGPRSLTPEQVKKFDKEYREYSEENANILKKGLEDE